MLLLFLKYFLGSPLPVGESPIPYHGIKFPHDQSSAPSAGPHPPHYTPALQNKVQVRKRILLSLASSTALPEIGRLLANYLLLIFWVSAQEPSSASLSLDLNFRLGVHPWALP